MMTLPPMICQIGPDCHRLGAVFAEGINKGVEGFADVVLAVRLDG